MHPGYILYFAFLLPWGALLFFCTAILVQLILWKILLKFLDALIAILYGGRGTIFVVEKIVNKCSPLSIAPGSVSDVPGNHILTVLSYKEARRGAELEAEGEGE